MFMTSILFELLEHLTMSTYILSKITMLAWVPADKEQFSVCVMLKILFSPYMRYIHSYKDANQINLN